MAPDAAAAPAAASASGRRFRLTIWALVGLGLALLIGANAHLVYVAFASRPDCVPHAKAPASHGPALNGPALNGEPPIYRAARSAC